MRAVHRCLTGLAKCLPRQPAPSKSSRVSARPVFMSATPAATPGALAGGAGGQNKPVGLSEGSPWAQASLAVKYPPLQEDTSADVVVVGAGIAGLTAAYNLAKGGKRVVLLESRVRGGGQTGRTTAHIMTWLDDYYYECEKMHGAEKTRLVADSLLKAVDFIERTAKEEGIECHFERLDGYLVPHATGESSTPTSSTGALAKELDASIRAGMADTEKVELSGGPDVGGYSVALRYPNNAQFHPLMYLEGLAAAAVRRGVRIFEGTKYWSAKEGHVQTADGHKVSCDAVVLATNSPINHNLAVHARQLPYRSYVVGLKIRKDKCKKALFWDTAEPYHYVRTEELDADHYLLIVGGEDHKTGSLYPYDPYDRLTHYARSRWTEAGEVVRTWNGQVMEPAGMLYLHGKDPLKPGSHTYIITGDSGQGMTGGTIGGMLVADLILGRPNPWAEVYDPSRVPPMKSLAEIADEGLTTTVSFAERVLPKITLDYDLAPNTGAVVQKGLHKVALFCDKDGNKHAFSAVCKHMGCLLHFNSVEKTWDCPCHGSHFDGATGKVLNGPAKGDLEPIDW